MSKVTLDEKSIEQLLLILQVALGDVDIAINQSHDVEEVEAYKKHKKLVRQWINYLQDKLPKS